MSDQICMFGTTIKNRDIPMQVDESKKTKVRTHDINYQKTDLWDVVPCPNCSRYIALNVYGFNRKYCEHCGQKLQWKTMKDIEE